MTATETHRAIDAVWRIESARIIASLARMVGDIGLAEELAQDALVVALEQWPESSFDRISAPAITLMTPEPDGGLYKETGVESFVRRFGYPDVQGRPDRINFGGIHAFAQQNARTRLSLVLTEFDEVTGKIKDANGGLALVSNGVCAALWSFKKLIEHWKKKHDKAAYVPNEARLGPPRAYRYGSRIQLGRGTEFEKFIMALLDGRVYYDPGIKLEGASTGRPSLKRRSQFRIKARDLKVLYRSFDEVAV